MWAVPRAGIRSSPCCERQPEETEMSTAQVTTSKEALRRFSDGSAGDADPRRWLILATICTAALMIVLDVTVMNLALPSAQRALGFTNADRQWIVTSYALSFGSLLLF